MFAYHETVIVVQGTATVVLDDGGQVSVHPGDMALFELGQGTTWTVHEDFRKEFHADSPDPLPF
jgi:uncharacterized cupin superfamily protein